MADETRQHGADKKTAAAEPKEEEQKRTTELRGEDERFRQLYDLLKRDIEARGLQGPLLVVYDNGTDCAEGDVAGGSEILLCDTVGTVRYVWEMAGQIEEVDAGNYVLPNSELAAREEAEKKRHPKTIVEEGHYLCLGGLRPVRMLGGCGAERSASQAYGSMMLDAENRHLIWENVSADEILDPELHAVYDFALKMRKDAYTTTSMVRLFEAAAAGLRGGEEESLGDTCVQLVSHSARVAEEKWRQGVYTNDMVAHRAAIRFIIERKDGRWMADGPRLLGDLIMAQDSGVPNDELALEFHDAIAEMTAHICGEIGWVLGEQHFSVRQVLLTGSVFADEVLKSRVTHALQAKGFTVHS